MSRPFARFLAALASSALLLLSAPALAQALPYLFAPGGTGVGAASTLALAPPSRMVARQRVVSVDMTRIAPSQTPSPALAVALFDGDVVTVDFVRIEVRGPGNFTWYGRVRDYDRGDVVLTVVNGMIAGGIGLASSSNGQARSYLLESLADGRQLLQELNPALAPPEHPPGWTGEPPAGTRFDGANVSPQADNGSTVDIMVVYSDQTAVAAGTAIGATIQYAVDRANLAYTNSGVGTQLRLVYSGPANYSESGDFSADLSRLQAVGDGYLDKVHALRDTYAADVVSLIIENNAYCGIGYLNAVATSAFTVVNRGCSGGNLSLAHEVGHNFGARHDPYVDSATSPYAYGHGYVYKPGMWRTVMAYDNDCNASGFSCSRLPYFSNPNVTNGGVPMGTAATHNNARVHNERAFTVANFRVAAPTASTTAATAIAANGATLNGTVSSNGASTTVTFQYGLTTGYGTTVTASGSPLSAGASATAVSASIVGLAPCTTYHFRVVAANGAGTTNGADAAFTTTGCLSAPTVTTTAPANVAATGATLNGTVRSDGAAAMVTFKYGLTSAYGTSVTAAQSPVTTAGSPATVSAAIGGLACGTTYHWALAATNSAGTAQSTDQTFATSACGSGAATTTVLASAANPSVAGTAVALMATVTGNAPTGTVAFSLNGTPVAGCGAVALAGSGNIRTASCTLPAQAAGTYPIDARYAGDSANQPSSGALTQVMVTAGALIGTVVANPYGTMQVTGGTLVGTTLSITASNAVLQLGGTAGSGNVAQIDFAGLHLAPGATLTIRSGAANQMLRLRNTNGDGSAIAGVIVAQGANGAPPPQLHIANPHGIALAATADVQGPAGLVLDALLTTTSGGPLTNAGNVDGGPFLDLFGMTIKGGGAFRGDEIDVSTPGTVNNPVAGAHYLGNSLQLHPSGGTAVKAVVNAYGSQPQFINLQVHGSAVVWMPSAWPSGWPLPANSAPLPPGAVRPAGAGEPSYGGGSIIVHSTGPMTLYRGGANDLAFPGGIALKAGGTLDLNGVTVNQGWTTTGKAFQGIYLEAPQIVSATSVQIFSNDLNWTNFSVLPSGSFRVSRLKAQADGTAVYVAADADAPHRNTYSVLIDASADLQCWTCLIDYAPIDVQ